MDRSAIEQETRAVAERWFGAMKKGDGAVALDCLADDVLWINNPPVEGLSDIIPWLGEYHGKDAVLETFKVWGAVAEVQSYELVDLWVRGDEVLAIVHEVARIKSTGLCYDIEFIQRFTVKDGHIAAWKPYWDTVRGIVAFRGISAGAGK